MCVHWQCSSYRCPRVWSTSFGLALIPRFVQPANFHYRNCNKRLEYWLSTSGSRFVSREFRGTALEQIWDKSLKKLRASCTWRSDVLVAVLDSGFTSRGLEPPPMCTCFGLGSIRAARNFHHRKRAYLEQAHGKSTSTSGSRFVDPGAAQHSDTNVEQAPKITCKLHVALGRVGGGAAPWFTIRGLETPMYWHATQRGCSYLLRCIQPQGISYFAIFPPSISALVLVVRGMFTGQIYPLWSLCASSNWEPWLFRVLCSCSCVSVWLLVDVSEGSYIQRKPSGGSLLRSAIFGLRFCVRSGCSIRLIHLWFCTLGTVFYPCSSSGTELNFVITDYLVHVFNLVHEGNRMRGQKRKRRKLR